MSRQSEAKKEQGSGGIGPKNDSSNAKGMRSKLDNIFMDETVVNKAETKTKRNQETSEQEEAKKVK